MKKRAILITSSQAYLPRVKLFSQTLESSGYEAYICITDFNHHSKARSPLSGPNVISVRTLAYRKNLSIARLVSRMDFSFAAYKVILREKPDLIYFAMPANSLGYFVSRYKKKNPETRIIADIVDAWPESFPLTRISKILTLPFMMWKKLREEGIRCASQVCVECDLYSELFGDRYQRIPWSSEDYKGELEYSPTDGEYNIAYLGSINHIIDIENVVQFLRNLRKERDVVFHIIGVGEKKQELIEKVKKYDVRVMDYGAIYDDEQKNKIFSKCDFGLNMMKDTVCVGLTMKSIEYLRFGLPIINNIKSDSKELVLRYQCGLNYDDFIWGKIEELGKEGFLKMRHQAKIAFDSEFSEKTVRQKISALISPN